MPRQKVSPNAKLDKLLTSIDERAEQLGVALEPDEFTKEWYAADWPARKKIFIEREIKIRDAFHKNQLVPFILNDAQLELLEASNEAYEDPSLEDYTLKCRRLGISTYYCADDLADCIIEDGHHFRLVAQDPKTVGALMKVVRNMYDCLRPELKPESKYNSKYELQFENHSRTSVSCVVPGHEEQGRGDTITRLHLTEIPFWNGDAETAATALCDATQGGKITGESTAKGVGDWFHQKFTQGRRHEGGIRAHFFEWWWNSNYQISNFKFVVDLGVIYLLKEDQKLSDLTDEQLANARLSDYDEKRRRENGLPMQSETDCAKKIAEFLSVPRVCCDEIIDPDEWFLSNEIARRLAWRRQQITKKGEKKFRVEYPENDVDPFAQTGSSVFDQNLSVVGCEPCDPMAGHSYIVSCDPSIGIEGNDPAVITVIDRHTGDQVYIWRGFEKQDSQGKRCCELSDKYYGADIVIESNMGEGAIIEVENRGYEHRLYKYIDVQTQRDIDSGKISMMDALQKARPGLPMTEKVKRTAIVNFEKAWRNGDFRACSQSLCDEAVVFVQTGNTMGAKSGYHDDEVMACAIGWFVIETDYVGKAGFIATGRKLGSARLGSY
jgi:hypothetical protein